MYIGTNSNWVYKDVGEDGTAEFTLNDLNIVALSKERRLTEYLKCKEGPSWGVSRQTYLGSDGFCCGVKAVL